MLTIYLTRHGQNEDNASGILNGRRDLPLTALGREQAHTLAAEIRESGIRFDAVYTSPLVRARETAEIITSAVPGLPSPLVWDDLIERDFGIMTGAPIASIVERCAPDILRTDTVTYFLSPSRAETFPDVLARATRALGAIEERHADGAVLLVGHGDIGKMLYAAYHSLPWEDVLRMFHFGNVDLVWLSRDIGHADAHVFRTAQHNH